MQRVSESTKHTCGRLAARVISASRLDSLPNAFEGCLGRRSNFASEHFPKDEVDAGRVGIWEPRLESAGTAYIRRSGDDSWTFWADVERIEPKNKRKRIVLLGESVARGFFYDPKFNPAAALSTIIESVSGPDSIEVIDLARSDLLLDGLFTLAHSAISLDPDVFVMLAGNNWYVPGTAPVIEPEEIARILRWERRWAPVTRFIESRTRETIQVFLHKLGALSRERGIPVVFLLPEFNLVDWRNEYPIPGMIPSSENARRWRKLKSDAEAAFAKGELDQAASLATEMARLAVEPEVASTELLAHILLSRGEREEARRLLERARDISLGLPVTRSPRCFAVIQKAVRDFAPSEGITLVDLPQRFAEYLDGDLPDRRLFHDYCHLTSDGIRVAMASAAEQLLPILNLPQHSWRELNRVPVSISSEVAAEAHFLAAMHNASWGQTPEIIQYHCDEALRLSNRITETFQLYLDFHISTTPTLLCRSFHELRAGGSAAAIKYFSFASPTSEKVVDFQLISTIVDALEPRLPGTKQKTWALLIKEHGVREQGCDLLHPSCSCGSLGEFPARWQGELGYYRAIEVESHFRFVCGEPKPLVLRLVCRVRTLASAEEWATLLLNGQEIFRFPVTAKWKNLSCEISTPLLQLGLNSIVIQWPGHSEPWEDRAHEIADQLEHGALPEVFAQYGNIYSFLVQPALAAPPRVVNGNISVQYPSPFPLSNE